MAKQKKKRHKPARAKEKIDWRSIFIGAIADLIVGLILLLIDKMTD